jgi:DNA-binding CsgD family transcriptional regulator
VLKDISADDLVACIRDVLAGKTYLAPAAAAKLAEGVTRVQLTPREMATLRLLADGKANKEIANELDISERTVKTHLAHLFEKARRDQPDGSDQSGDASRPGAFGISPRREATEIASVCDAAPILEYNAASRCSISLSDKPSVIASWQSTGPPRATEELNIPTE